MAPGVFLAEKKDGTPYWRASVTHKGKHISLGSFDEEALAERAYLEACKVLRGDPDTLPQISDHDEGSCVLPFSKWVALINFRDNGIWCRGPIYLRKGYFEYYLSATEDYRFGPDDLFYYTHHTIQKRGGHLFVADYGMQVSVLSRYGVRPYSVPGRDHYFKNGDDHDYRPGNLVVVNRYMGVQQESRRKNFVARINMGSGKTVVVGHYDTEEEAAIAYNKAVDVLKAAGSDRAYEKNYLDDVSPAKYIVLYNNIKIREGALLDSFASGRKKVFDNPTLV